MSLRQTTTSMLTSVIFFSITFYRAINDSAKRGIETACRLSACLSVSDVGGSG